MGEIILIVALAVAIAGGSAWVVRQLNNVARAEAAYARAVYARAVADHALHLTHSATTHHSAEAIQEAQDYIDAAPTVKEAVQRRRVLSEYLGTKELNV